MNHFKGKQFQKDVIIISVGYYLRYNLSYLDVQEMLYDRGINVSHTTIYRWVQEYGKLIYQIWKKKNRQSFYSWKMDETYIKIKGKWHYLYRAIDSEGMTLDIWLRRKRNTQSAYAFFKRLYKQFGEPKVIVTDKAPSIASAFRKLQKQRLYSKTEHRTVKYLNNLIEQDHRPVKRRNKLYQSLRTASTTIKGVEALRGIYKKNRRNGTLFGFSVSTEIKVLMGIPAQSKYQNGTFVLSIETLQQNLQDGRRNLFETLFRVTEPVTDVVIPEMDSDDGLGYLQGEKMSYVNRTASEGTLLAPVDGGVPNMIIEVDKPSTSLKQLLPFLVT